MNKHMFSDDLTKELIVICDAHKICLRKKFHEYGNMIRAMKMSDDEPFMEKYIKFQSARDCCQSEIEIIEQVAFKLKGDKVGIFKPAIKQEEKISIDIKYFEELIRCLYQKKKIDVLYDEGVRLLDKRLKGEL